MVADGDVGAEGAESEMMKSITVGEKALAIIAGAAIGTLAACGLAVHVPALVAPTVVETPAACTTEEVDDDQCMICTQCDVGPSSLVVCHDVCDPQQPAPHGGDARPLEV